METNFIDKYGMRPYDEYTIKWLEKSARQGVLKKNLLKNANDNYVYIKSFNTIINYLEKYLSLKTYGEDYGWENNGSNDYYVFDVTIDAINKLNQAVESNLISCQVCINLIERYVDDMLKLADRIRAQRYNSLHVSGDDACIAYVKNAYNAVYKSANDILKARIKTLKALGHEELVKKYKEWIDDEEELTYVSNRISYVYNHVESKWYKILAKSKTRKLKW